MAIEALITQFTIDGVYLPPLTCYGSPGGMWPSSGPLRIDFVSTGTPGARLRVLGMSSTITFEAKRVVSGTPTGSWIDVSNTDDYVITEAEGETATFDLRGTFITRAAGLFVRGFAEPCILASAGSGY